MRTTFSKEIDEPAASDTILTQNPPKNGEDDVKWPVKVKHRNKTYAKIYRPCTGRASYRVCWRTGGERQMKSFKTYSGENGARKFADSLVKELAQQSPVAQLTAAQAEDALSAIAVMNEFRLQTGRNISLTTAASEFCGASKILKTYTPTEAATGFMQTAAVVVPTPIGVAVEDFLKGNKPKTETADGKRAQLSSKHHYNQGIHLRRFANALSGHSVCDLTKDHLDSFINGLGDQKSKSRNQRKIASAKSRNHYRADIRQFLTWCVRKDFLSPAHRLLEADSLRPELANTAEVEFYTPDEFKKVLDAAKGELAGLRPLIAIGGLAGLRTAEMLRLDWADVWRVPGHIEVTAGKAKTRQRRLVEICTSLTAWLADSKAPKTGKLWPGHEITFQQKLVEVCAQAKVPRKHNGLRHSFCTYHFAKDANENMTAAQAGNSPAMIHGHYKGLATKADAEKWFALAPAQTESAGGELTQATPPK